ncbi:MAG: hypothetical protein CBB92_01385 [Flammeovirgaceae bacterium TMED32]|nr:MAG: hypothetical protein CBB92_01385 [Flammeovirgaceae bacterium TMED32]|tara:strand:+ start:963 stop:1643 length:681 start_codon:yes stop_codon:yes gene_type:complete
MDIPINQIWNFIALRTADTPKQRYSLHAAHVIMAGLDAQSITELTKKKGYDTELLPSLFTYREILWQPNVFEKPQLCTPAIRIFKAFCEEKAAEYDQDKGKMCEIYSGLLKGLAENCVRALKDLEKKRQPVSIHKVLKELRNRSFPIIKFFIDHPQNRNDYYSEAVNRLNYAIKISITEFNGRFTEFEEPFWRVENEQTTLKKETRAAQKKSVTEEEPLDEEKAIF